MYGMTLADLDRGAMLIRFVRAAVRLRNAMERELRKVEAPLTAQGVEVLRGLAERGPLTRARLSRLLSIQAPSLDHAVEELERNGWITRERQPGRKFVHAHPTEAGLAVLKRALTCLGALEPRLFRGVGPEYRELVLSIVLYGADTLSWEEPRVDPLDRRLPT